MTVLVISWEITSPLLSYYAQKHELSPRTPLGGCSQPKGSGAPATAGARSAMRQGWEQGKTPEQECMGPKLLTATERELLHTTDGWSWWQESRKGLQSLPWLTPVPILGLVEVKERQEWVCRLQGFWLLLQSTTLTLTLMSLQQFWGKTDVLSRSTVLCYARCSHLSHSWWCHINKSFYHLYFFFPQKL